MAAAAAEAAEDELDEHSPSKRFYGIGDFAGIGFINALIDNVSKAGKAGREIAKSSIDGLNERVSEMEVQNGESSSAGNTYQFTQNNYSPKALSRIDIYRQTKNQFSAMKGLVSNT